MNTSTDTNPKPEAHIKTVSFQRIRKKHTPQKPRPTKQPKNYLFTAHFGPNWLSLVYRISVLTLALSIPIIDIFTSEFKPITHLNWLQIINFNLLLVIITMIIGIIYYFKISQLEKLDDQIYQTKNKQRQSHSEKYKNFNSLQVLAQDTLNNDYNLDTLSSDDKRLFETGNSNAMKKKLSLENTNNTIKIMYSLFFHCLVADQLSPSVFHLLFWNKPETHSYHSIVFNIILPVMVCVPYFFEQIDIDIYNLWFNLSYLVVQFSFKFISGIASGDPIYFGEAIDKLKQLPIEIMAVALWVFIQLFLLSWLVVYCINPKDKEEVELSSESSDDDSDEDSWAQIEEEEKINILNLKEDLVE